MALKDRTIHHIINPVFLEDKCSFLSKELGKQDLLTEPAFKEAYGLIETYLTETHQKYSNTANDGEVPYGINNKGDNNKISDGNKDDCCLRTIPPTRIQLVNTPEEH
jgi:hypothetical protein